MEKSFLSQEEIDALLKGDGADTNDTNGQSAVEYQGDALTVDEQDVLSEIGNINVGAASTALSELLDQRVTIDTPKLKYSTLNEIHQGFSAPYVLVEVKYTTGIEGNNMFIIQTHDAAIIANIMMGGTGENVSEEMDEYTLSAVAEAMNQMMGFSATALSELFKQTIEISPPQVTLISIENYPEQIEMDIFEQLVTTSFKLQIGDLVESQIILIVSLEIARKHVNYLLEDTARELDSLPVKNEPPIRENIPSPAAVKSVPDDLAFLSGSTNLSLILDVPLRLSVLLGRTKRSIADILKLTHGSIVELERLENEPVDILVNEKLIARGEVVVVKEYFGVRITEIISQENRIKNLVQ